MSVALELGKEIGMVDIGGGYLQLTTSTDPKYPGLIVEFVSNDEDILIEKNPEYVRPSVLIEHPKGENVSLYVWNNQRDEDYQEKITLFDMNGGLNK